MKPAQALVTFVLVLILSACDNTMIEREPAILAAEIEFVSAFSTPESLEFSGNGFFREARVHGLPFRPRFSLTSTGTIGGGKYGFAFHASFVPEVGSYELSPSLDDSTVVARIERWSGSTFEQFVSDEGTLSIHTAGPERIAGSFTYSGTLSATCVSQPNIMSCKSAESDERVTARGTFEAIPGNPSLFVLMSR